MKIIDIQKIIDAYTGVCIEIGGPSPDGYTFLEDMGLKLPKHILVTNIANPVVLNPFGDSPKEYSVDAVIDVKNLPYDEHTLDMLITNSLPHNLHEILIINASVALRSKGILLIENQLSSDIELAHANGFKPLLSEKLSSKYYSQMYQLK